MGDVVMTEPAIRALAEQRPGRHITLLTSGAGAKVAELLPCVDDVVIHEAPWMKSATAAQASDGRPDLALVERLRAGRFDAAVIFTVYSQSALPAALLLHLADVPLRLAYSRENPYRLLTDWVKETEPGPTVRHEVRRHLDLVARRGARPASDRIRVTPRPGACESVGRLLFESGVRQERDWIVVHPGASAPSRRYPAESYAATLRLLARKQGLLPVLTGSSDEAAMVAEIAREAGVEVLDLAGRLDLHELAALLARAPLLLANNTGPVHLAAGVGTPVVDLYALTNPQHTPWGVPSRVLFHDVPCRFCYRSECPEGHHACLRLVEPERVAGAVADLLAETAPGAAGPRTVAAPRLEAAGGVT
jgi:lipopolysaccharide heptosyltransferase II